MKSRWPETAYFILCLLLIISRADAQERVVKGIVIDQTTRQPLAGANVYLSNTTTGTTTDADGYFMLVLPQSPRPDSLICSYLGYQDYHHPLSDLKDRLLITLIPEILVTENVITVYADKLDLARKELPHTAHVLEAEKIERYGTAEISDLFKLDPAVRVEGNDLDGRFIQIRNSDPDEVNVYVDGILMNSMGYNNAADISVIAPENIQKLEILKGSNLLLLGSGAFGGVVNISTRQKTEREFSLKLKSGSSASYWLAADLNVPLTDRVFVNYFGNLGTVSPQIEFYRSEQYGEKSTTTAVKTIKQNHHLTLNYFNTDGQFTGKVMGYLLDYDKPQWKNIRKNMFIAAAYKGAIFDFRDFDLNIDYLYGDDVIDRSAPGLATFTSSFQTQRLHLRVAKNFSNDPKTYPQINFQFLSEYFHDELYSEQQLSDQNRKSTLYDEFMYDNRGSLGGVVSIGDKIDTVGNITWKLFGGIRGEFLATGDRYKISTYGFQIDIRMANWWFTPFLNFGENIKFPSLLDNGYLTDVQDLSINHDDMSPVRLIPEFAKSREFGFNLSHHPLNTFFETASIQIAYFTSEIANKLLKRPLENVIVETQLGTSQTRGVEGTLSLERIYDYWTTSVSYAEFDVTNPLLYAYKPESKLTFQLELTIPSGFYFMGLIYQEGKSIAWDYNDLNQFVTATVPAFFDIDISLGYQFDFSGVGLNLTLAGYNILDNAGYRFYNLKKQFFQAGISLRY